LNQFDHQVWMQTFLDWTLSTDQKQSWPIDFTKHMQY